MPSSSDDISDKVKKHEQSTLPFESLIAGPINAIIAAQRYSAHATYQYIISLMNSLDDNTLTPKMLEIITSKIIQLSGNDNSKENGNTDTDFEEKKQLLKVPLLSLLPVPYISIDEAEIIFNVDIIYNETQKDTADYKESNNGKKNIPFFTEPVKMHAVFVSSNESTKNIKSHLSVKIKLKQQDQPLGLEKYLQILGNSITVNDVQSKR